MMLYLLRHGQAEPRAASDAERRLTAAGEREVASVARQFLRNRLPLTHCFCSPYTRAAQTAAVFLEQVDPALTVETCALLTPEVRASETMRYIDTLHSEHVLLVSHNPLISELNALLTNGDISNMHILATSELVALELDIVGLGMADTILSLMPEADLVAN